ncbi:PREDICTED: uncharacterized protein LOC107339362 isoform X4 [Acropora digitifera]|uniref:uncharacterized protein LOC107339362 isoform X4 n=1 Tax=Acropora digitifera TaxID=70779 RepID=UPI00077B22C9|nr:PREDICTED: uncharacterized protein LOC107339362 isoform X4 [Acropora digitifera]
MLILQRNVFSGCGIVLLVQAHTTVGMVATVIMAVYPTTNKAMLQVQRNVFSGCGIVLLVQAHTTVGMAETEIMEVYPTTNKAMLQVQRNVFSGCGIVLLVQAHTTVGMVATVIMAASTTIRIPVAETEIMEVYPTTNMDKGALFIRDVLIMIVVSSSTFNTLNY